MGDLPGDVVVTAQVSDGPADTQPTLNVVGNVVAFRADAAGDYTLAITDRPLGTQTSQRITVHVQPGSGPHCHGS